MDPGEGSMRMPWFYLERTGTVLRLCAAADPPETSTAADSGYIAISYIWGSPPYTPNRVEVVPTTSPSPETHKTIKLGWPWTWERFVICLWLATEGHPFWLDQLSLPQDKSLRRRLVTMIPNIFKKFPVRVLVDTNRCTFVRELTRVDLQLVRNIVDRYKAYLVHLKHCSSCLYLELWSSRLWTRQEAYNARSLSFIYLDLENQNFHHRPHEFQRLAAAHHLQQNLHVMLRDKTGTSLMPTMSHILQNVERAERMVTTHAFELSLLRGDVLSFDQQVPFHQSIVGLGQARKQASDPKDLVLAVWCDLPGYTVPQAVAAMGTYELLDDASQQYQRLTGRYLPFLCSTGLLGATTRIHETVPVSGLESNPHTLSWYAQWLRPAIGVPIAPERRRIEWITTRKRNFKTIEQFISVHRSRETFTSYLTTHYDIHEIQALSFQLYSYVVELHARGAPMPWKETSDAFELMQYAFDSHEDRDFDALLNAGAVQMICLLYMGMPDRVLREFAPNVCFTFDNGVWTLSYSLQKSGDVRLLMIEGAPAANLAVVNEDGQARIVGCCPAIVGSDGLGVGSVERNPSLTLPDA